MKKILFILLLTIPFLVNGQGWQQTYGDSLAIDIGYSALQTNDGGYIVTGWTNSYSSGTWGYYDVYLLKTDIYGVEQWNQTYGGIQHDEGYSVLQTNDGGYIICGWTLSFGSGDEDLYLIKTDAYGDSLWTQTFGGVDSERGWSIQQTTDGGYIICGNTKSYGNGDNDVYLVKTDGNGQEEWVKTFGGTNTDESYAVCQTNDGGYIITGHTRSFGNSGVYLIKTDSIGTEQWFQTYGTYFDKGFSVQQTTDGGYIICGTTFSTSSGNRDVYIIKTDGNGTEQWSQAFGGTESDYGNSIEQTLDGGYVIVGVTVSPGNLARDIYLIKTDSIGDSLWTLTLGGIGNDEGNTVQQTPDGGYIICATVFTGNGYNACLIKTDGNGNITSTFNISTPNPNRKIEETIDLLGKQTKPQTNIPFIKIYDDGTVEKRIIID
jgi:hypothetical protein